MDRYIEKSTEGKVVADRTIINKGVSTARAPDAIDMSELPEGTTHEQAAFMKTFENDARERAQRRKQVSSTLRAHTHQNTPHIRAPAHIRAHTYQSTCVSLTLAFG